MDVVMDSKDLEVISQFRQIVSDASNRDPIPRVDTKSAIDIAFAAVQTAVEGGGWLHAADAGTSKAPIALVSGLIEAAATIIPPAAYPLAEALLARRFLGLVDIPDSDIRTGVVVGNAMAVVSDREDLRCPHAERVETLIFLAPGVDEQWNVMVLNTADATWRVCEGSNVDVTRPLYRRVGSAVPAKEVATIPHDLGLGLAAESLIYEAAEMLGCAQGLFEATVRHTSTRRQFGRPLASFQAVSHRMADLYVELETVRSLTVYAAWAAQHRPEQAMELSLTAKGMAGNACWRMADEAIQFHGALGFTWEMALHLPTGRIMMHALTTPTSRDCLRQVGETMASRGSMVGLLD